MSAVVDLSAARILASNGAVARTFLVGCNGGYTVRLEVGDGEQTLVTRGGRPRVFSSLDSAAKLLRDELGLVSFAVDATSYELGERRTRPDRAAAMRVRDEDARYTAMLREAALEAQADTRPGLSHAETRHRMDQFKAKLQARLDVALGDGEA